MKSHLDIIAAAKRKCSTVSIEDADHEIAQSDVVIDVREESEYAAGHLPGALHMSRGVIEASLSLNPAFHKPDTRIFLYCRSDARASLVAVSLQDMGFKHVKVLAGGMLAWTAANKPVQK